MNEDAQQRLLNNGNRDLAMVTMVARSLSIHDSQQASCGRLYRREEACVIAPRIRTPRDLDINKSASLVNLEKAKNISENQPVKMGKGLGMLNGSKLLSASRSPSSSLCYPESHCSPNGGTSTTARRRRRVRFTKTDEIMTGSPAAADMMMNSREQDDLVVSPQEYYWASSQIAKLHQRGKRLAAEYAKKRPDHVKSIEVLFDSHSNQKKALQQARQQHDEQHDALLALQSQDEQAVRILTESGSRGLEQHISPVVRTHRRWAVKNILQLQSKLRGQDPELVRSSLKVRSQQISEKSAHFARKMAEGDAAVARRQLLLSSGDDCQSSCSSLSLH